MNCSVMAGAWHHTILLLEKGILPLPHDQHAWIWDENWKETEHICISVFFFCNNFFHCHTSPPHFTGIPGPMEALWMF